MMAEARARGIDLTVDQIRDILINTARRNPPTGNAWHRRYGHGRVSASAAVQAVIDVVGGGGPPAPVASGGSPKKKTTKKKTTKKKSKRT